MFASVSIRGVAPRPRHSGVAVLVAAVAALLIAASSASSQPAGAGGRPDRNAGWSEPRPVEEAPARASTADERSERWTLPRPPAEGRVLRARDRAWWAGAQQAEAMARRDVARARARMRGLPLEGTTPDGRRFELVAFEGERPLYLITTNVAAAISGATDLVRQTAPFGVSGSGVAAGVWDEARVRLSHQEFGGRVITGDSSTGTSNHATHVAGTIGAAGINASALGMAPAIDLVTFDWTADAAEVLANGTAWPGQPGTLQVTNHSYTLSAGWRGTDWLGLFTVGGNPADFYDPLFGRYTSYSASLDANLHSLRYALQVVSAANERNDGPPAAGTKWKHVATGLEYTYDPAAHPRGDGVYKNGYDTMTSLAVAKNVITVGAVNDAVSGGVRNLAAATMTAFSSWGPADDGRIKPDLVANGASVFSAGSGSDTAYSTLSGTSMAAPSVAGSAALLVDYWARRFPGQALRGATLKALLIHTADDLGRPGPDYSFGWGLLNTAAAAALLLDYADAPAQRRLIESSLTATRPSEAWSVSVSGGGPLRVTLVWFDPAGPPQSNHDSRTRMLVNDLNLRVVGPGGVTHRPFVWPPVGSWRWAPLAANATTGINTVDPVEQVWIPTAAAGTYTIVVDHAGTLTNGLQEYSLVITGAVASGPVVPSLTSSPGILPAAADSRLEVGGENFLLGATVELRRPGLPPARGFGFEIEPHRAAGFMDTAELPTGWWDIAVVNPDGMIAAAPGGVELRDPLALFEDDLTVGAGWTNTTTHANAAWRFVTDSFNSPPRALHAPNLNSAQLASVVSPAIALPSGTEKIELSFWQRHQFGNGDGGILELSADDGLTWVRASDPVAQATFRQGGYNGQISNSTNSLGSGTPAWTGSNTTWSQVVVTLGANRYAGGVLRARWSLGTNNNGSGNGWWIDDIAVQADLTAAWTPFGVWRQRQTGAFDTESSLDLDGDGLSLLAEYAFGGTPDTHDPAPLAVRLVEGQLEVEFPFALKATDLVYTLEVAESPATASWSTAATFRSTALGLERTGTALSSPVGIEPGNRNGFVRVIERLAQPAPEVGRQFARVRITHQPAAL
jgi:subtilisin family serine protease